MKDIYFISDAHLDYQSKSPPDKEVQYLIDFLEYLNGKCEELYVVGDLFDFWFEYRYMIPKYHHRILFKFYQLIENQVNVTYLAGNHDFWLGNFFEKEIGMNTFSNPIERVIAGKRFYISHGDGLATNDTGYRILRKILRHPISIAIWKLIHPDLGVKFAKLTSQSSRIHTNGRYFNQTATKNAIQKKFDEGFDYVIMGHQHYPIHFIQGNHTHVNLGDWMNNFTYARFDGTDLTLEKWPTGEIITPVKA